MQTRAPFRLFSKDIQGCQGGGRHPGWLSRCVDVGARELGQVLDQSLAPCDEGPGGAKPLAQGADQHGYLIDAVVAAHAAVASLAQHAHAVGIVDHQPGSVATSGGRQAGNIGNVAIHAEDTVAHHQPGVVGLAARQ